jgi:hypothetical protein
VKDQGSVKDQAAPAALKSHLEFLARLRGAEAPVPARLAEVKRWQQQRLAATYADLAADDRFARATAFFLEQLYGPKDFSSRDAQMLRIYPAMVRILPASALETAALAIEVDALSEALDRRLAAMVDAGPLDWAAYAKAYRTSSTLAERQRQIALIEGVGQRLERLVRKPIVHSTLKLMRRPARMAGLSGLQNFLEEGFESFRGMNGAAPFLRAIVERETALVTRLFSPEPFSPSAQELSQQPA